MSNVLKKGSQGAEVVTLQEKLQALGFSLEVDGIFGDVTHNTVVALQTIFGYDVDGIAGKATQGLLDQQQRLGWNLERARQHGYPQGGASA